MDQILQPLGARKAARLDVPLAAMLAASVAFFLYAMPDRLFAGLGGSFGAGVLDPAARLIPILLAAGLTFLITWLVLRALDAKPQATAADAPEATIDEAEVVRRLRRADAHPDAPGRPPLMARNLGDPMFDEGELAEGDDDILDLQPAEMLESEREEPAQWPLEEAVTAEAETGIVDGDYEEIAEVEADGAEAYELESLAPPAGDEPTITDLMRRLERGIARRQSAEEDPVNAADAERKRQALLADERLQDALGELQRMAGRRD